MSLTLLRIYTKVFFLLIVSDGRIGGGGTHNGPKIVTVVLVLIIVIYDDNIFKCQTLLLICNLIIPKKKNKVS